MKSVRYEGPFWDFLRVERGVSEQWAKSLKRRLEKFRNWLEENGYPKEEPEEIPKLALREWHEEMKTKYASQTVRKRLSAISNWYQFHDCHDLNTMVFRTPSDGRTEKEYYTTEEANMMWRTSKKMGPKYHALVACNLGAGLRRIGCYRLKWKNIDLENRKMKIIGKAKKRRTIVLTEKVTRILEKWKEEQQEAKFVFTKRNGERPSRRKTLGDWLNKIAKEADVNLKDGFRQGRRSFGRDLYEATKKIVVVSNYLGHTDTKTTMEYLQIEGFDMKKEICKLDQMVNTTEQIIER